MENEIVTIEGEKPHIISFCSPINEITTSALLGSFSEKAYSATNGIYSASKMRNI